MTTMTADPNPVVLGTDTFLTISATATVGLCNPSCFNPEVTSVTGTFFFGDGSSFPINFLFADPTVSITTSHLYTTGSFFDVTFFGTIEWTEQNVGFLDGMPVVNTFGEVKLASVTRRRVCYHFQPTLMLLNCSSCGNSTPRRSPVVRHRPQRVDVCWLAQEAEEHRCCCNSLKGVVMTNIGKMRCTAVFAALALAGSVAACIG